MNSASSSYDSANFSGNSRTTLKKRTLLFRYLAEINLIFGAWYLQWRITYSINFDALWLSIPLLLAEIYSYFGGVMFVIGLWRPIVRQVKSLNQLIPPLPNSDWANVDVFITCYNEPSEMVEETARAALAIDYPTTKLRVYVLDDGNSEQMRAMSEKLALEYLQSPLLQQEANRIDAELSTLNQRIEQLESLAPEVKAAEEWLQKSSLNTSNNFEDIPARFVHSLQQFILWLNPQHQNSHHVNKSTIYEHLNHERSGLELAIRQKELELVQLVRLRYIARPKQPGVPHHAKAGNLNYAIFLERPQEILFLL